MQVGSLHRPSSEINVTPLIDVVLVLLIIFMVITPMMLQSHLVLLPRVTIEPDPLPEDATKPLLVRLAADGTLALRLGEAEESLDSDALFTKLRVQLQARDEKQVFVDASSLVRHEQAVTLFDEVERAGGVPAMVDVELDE